MASFLAGAITTGYLVAGLFFLRFWRRTGDVLFAIFTGAFALLAIHQGVIALVGIEREAHSWVYLLRFAAFTLIALAILLKNLMPRRPG